MYLFRTKSSRPIILEFYKKISVVVSLITVVKTETRGPRFPCFLPPPPSGVRSTGSRLLCHRVARARQLGTRVISGVFEKTARKSYRSAVSMSVSLIPRRIRSYMVRRFRPFSRQGDRFADDRAKCAPVVRNGPNVTAARTCPEGPWLSDWNYTRSEIDFLPFRDFSRASHAI